MYNDFNFYKENGMSDIFDDLEEVDDFDNPEEVITQEKHPTLDARRRLEKMLEERRLREELEDFMEY